MRLCKGLSCISHNWLKLIYNDRAIVKVLTFVKVRSFSRSKEELWLDEWSNPLAQEVSISRPQQFLENLQQPIGQDGYVYSAIVEPCAKRSCSRLYHDKIPTGFLAWKKGIKGYKPVLDGENPLSWDAGSLPCLDVIKEAVQNIDYIRLLSTLWGQESSKAGGTLDVRQDNVLFFKYLGK